MKKRATLKDIANALNVSITTVSRALNDKDDIGKKTKKKILDVARMMDYKPNSIAVSLRKKVNRKLIRCNSSFGGALFFFNDPARHYLFFT